MLLHSSTYSTVATFGTMTYALVPLPETKFNGTDKLTVSEEDFEKALKQVRINYKKGLPLKVVRYRTRPQVTDDELIDGANNEQIPDDEDPDDPSS